MRICLSVIAVSLMLGPGAAQSTVYVPDNSSSTGAACNVIPFSPTFLGGGGGTYVGRIPASFLSTLPPADRRLVEISFAPCGTGAWGSTSVKFAVGHLPTPLSSPMSFPTAAGLGSFLDLTWIYDAATQPSPFSWTTTANVWSPLGFAALGGTSFCWNGTNDIGFYLTYQSTGTTMTGAFTGSAWRSGTEPYRHYAGGFGAPASTGYGAAGLKMKLDFAGVCGPALYQVNSADSSLTVNGVFGTPSTPAVVPLPLNAVATVVFASTQVNLPWEVGFTLAPLVPLGGGALATANGQTLNLDVTSPSLFFLNGGPFPSFSTPFPGNTTLPFGVGAFPFILSAQQLNVAPLNPDGFALSQGVQLVVQ